MVDIFEAIPTSDKLLRQAMFIAFDGKCFYTGRGVAFDEMHIDHIRPRSNGGQDCIANYVLCCQEINLKKLDRHADSFEEVVTETVKLLFADRVASVLDDLRLNTGGFVRPNDWLRENGIIEHSTEWHRLRNKISTRGLHSVSRVISGKSRGIVMYRRADLDAILAEYKGHAQSAARSTTATLTQRVMFWPSDWRCQLAERM